ncbi:unnamed protein product [Commensalibacter communis]|uniref:hypothetical protein n=1 Tax=Commensalibacter communis TaxID=2972786 RepID=UPI0022FF6276|nr:hypothetical protein [Commensalibacter communis]CAI3958597.1 unnamed protein product [Commensalibacter communis]
MKYKHLLTVKQFYVISIIINVVFWFLLLSSIYTSDTILQIQEVKENNFDFSGHLSGNYVPSIAGCYMFSEWLRSEKAYELLTNQLDVKSIYKKGDLFTKFGGIYDLFMHGDRSEWSYFNKNLTISINNNSNTININLSSYNNEDSKKILYEIITIGKEFLQSSHKEEDQKLINYISFLSSSLDRDLKETNTILGNYIKEGISIYPKENYLNNLLIKNIIENKLMNLDITLNSMKTLTFPVYQAKIAQKVFIQEKLNKLYFHDILQIQNSEKMEDTLNKKHFIENLKQSIEQKKYMLQKKNYIDRYQITVISPPSLLIERSGPYRVKGFFATLLVISLIYWLIKE